MAGYTADIVRTASATLGIGSLEAPGSGMRRIKLYEFIWGYSGAPSDNSAELEIQRGTAAATGTAVTPVALDPADAAAVSLVKENLSANGTLTANTFVRRVPMHIRSTFRWIAREGKEIVVPATAAAILAFLTPTTQTIATAMTIDFEEQ